MFKPDDFINRNLWGKRALDALKITKKAIQDAQVPTPLNLITSAHVTQCSLLIETVAVEEL